MQRGFVVAARVALFLVVLFAVFDMSVAKIPDARPPLADRRFTSTAVDDAIAKLVPKLANQDLAQIFANTYPVSVAYCVIFNRQ